MTATIAFAKTFLKEQKNLPPNRREAVTNAILRFLAEPGRAGLNFRPLAGKPGHFIINGAHGDRIILRKDGAMAYTAVDVGPHDNIYRRMNRR